MIWDVLFHKHEFKLSRYLVLTEERMVPGISFNLYVKSCKCGSEKVFLASCGQDKEMVIS